jgi:hypothetical protein
VGRDGIEPSTFRFSGDVFATVHGCTSVQVTAIHGRRTTTNVGE